MDSTQKILEATVTGLYDFVAAAASAIVEQYLSKAVLRVRASATPAAAKATGAGFPSVVRLASGWQFVSAIAKVERVILATLPAFAPFGFAVFLASVESAWVANVAVHFRFESKMIAKAEEPFR